MRSLFLRELRRMLGIEQQLLDDVLPRLRGNARATDVQRVLDGQLLETEMHVGNLRRVFVLLGERDDALESDALAGLGPDDGGDVPILAGIMRMEHLAVGAYEFLVRTAQALGLDAEVVHLLQLNMEQDEHAGEQAECTLAKLLAETVETPRYGAPMTPTL